MSLLHEVFSPGGAVSDIHPRDAQTPNLTLYYAPWCAHCKGYAPIYADIAKRIKRVLPDFNVYAVNIDKHKSALQAASALSIGIICHGKSPSG